MIINDVNILVTKIKEGINKKEQHYYVLDILVLDSGDTFNIVSKDIELCMRIDVMTKYKVNLELSSSKYGLRLSIKEVLKEFEKIN